MGQDLQSSSWDSTNRCPGPNCSPGSTIRYVRCSSDDGPEFSSAATADFLTRWEVRHRMSSAYFPQSNCRAEVAVKKAKRMLMDNVGPTGFLNNDGLLGALGPTRRNPIARYHRWYLAGPFAMLLPSSADASSTTTHRYVPRGARYGPKRRTPCDPGCRALQKP